MKFLNKRLQNRFHGSRVWESAARLSKLHSKSLTDDGPRAWIRRVVEIEVRAMIGGNDLLEMQQPSNPVFL